MYLARNKPEELAKKLQDMTENMVQFNEETKQYEFPPEVRMQLKAAGDQLGIDVGKMTEMAMQTAKLKDVKMKLNVGGNITDESIQEKISNMSRMEDGEFKVDFLGANGEKLTKTLDQLNNQDVEMIMKTPENEEDYMRQMIYNSQTTNERLKNINDSFEKGFLKDIDVYSQVENMTKKTIDQLESTVGESLQSIKESFKNSDLGQALTESYSLGGSLDETLSKMVEGIGAALKLSTDINNPNEISIDEVGNVIFKGSVNVTADPSANVTASNNTSSSSSSSSSSVINPLNPVNNNTVSNNVIAPIVPTNINSKVDFGELVISGKIEVVSQGNTLSSVDLTNIKPELEKMIITHLNGTYRNGGVPSSKQSIGVI
jgi:cell wall assembly regulator SMI1